MTRSATTTSCSASRATATEDEIKKAFRALARELHPDVSDDPDAEERFKEVVEAYEVLSNSERRELYDRYGHAGLRSGGFTPRASTSARSATSSPRSSATTCSASAAGAARARGADVGAEVEIELVEAARGVTSARSRSRSPSPCATCGGTAPSRARRPVDLPDAAAARAGCSRSRAPSSASSSARRPAAAAAARAGSSRRLPDCDGAGRTIEERTLEVEIPAGIHDGQRIRIAGEGHAGALGGRAGDVYVLVRVRPDPRFVREGERHLISTVDLTMTQAALGATRDRPDARGRRRARVRAGHAARRGPVLRGAGMPVLQGCGRGDHRAARQRRRPAAADRRAARPARGVRAQRRRATTYSTTRGSSRS